jgi:hypothetical protein
MSVIIPQSGYRESLGVRLQSREQVLLPRQPEKGNKQHKFDIRASATPMCQGKSAAWGSLPSVAAVIVWPSFC